MERKLYLLRGPDFVLRQATHILLDGVRLPIEDYKDRIYNSASEMSAKALRVLALAYREKDCTGCKDKGGMKTI